MDLEVVKIGHGRGSTFRESHPVHRARNAQQPRAPLQIVEIHNGEGNYVGEINARILTRFSSVAAEKFPRPQQVTSAQSVAETSAAASDATNVSATTGQPQNASSPAAPTNSAPVQISTAAPSTATKSSSSAAAKPTSENATDSGSLGGVDVSKAEEMAPAPASDAAAGPSTQATAATVPKGKGKGRDKQSGKSKGPVTHSTAPPALAPRLQPGPAVPTAPKAPAAPSAPARLPKLRMVLRMGSFEMSTNNAVQYALTWMRRNANSALTRPMDQYAAEKLQTGTLVELVDLYQAALAFGLRPGCRLLRDALIARITSQEASYDTFTMLEQCLPLRDPVMTEVLRVHEQDCCYGLWPQGDQERFEAYVYAPGNEALAARFDYLCRDHARRRRATFYAARGAGQNGGRGGARGGRGGRGGYSAGRVVAPGGPGASTAPAAAFAAVALRPPGGPGGRGGRGGAIVQR